VVARARMSGLFSWDASGIDRHILPSTAGVENGAGAHLFLECSAPAGRVEIFA
jgi:hypothetical protein